MSFRAVIFDLDGTLIESARGIERCLAEAISAIMPARAPARRTIREFIGPPVREMARRLLPEVSDSALDQIVAEFRCRYNREGWRETSLYDGVHKTLAWLRAVSIRCFLVTNKPATPTRLLLEHFDLSRCFLDTLSPDSASPSFEGKAQALAHLCKKHELSRHRSLYVGDSAEDAAAARATGLAFAAATYGYGQTNGQWSATADLRLRRLTDLRTLLSDTSLRPRTSLERSNVLVRGETL